MLRDALEYRLNTLLHILVAVKIQLGELDSFNLGVRLSTTEDDK